MILHFKVGRHNIHFLWCSSLRIDNVRMIHTIKLVDMSTDMSSTDKVMKFEIKKTKNCKPLNFERKMSIPKRFTIN